MFKVGDEVVCINNNLSCETLTKHKKYSIIKVTNADFIQIINDHNEEEVFHPFRFRKYEELPSPSEPITTEHKIEFPCEDNEPVNHPSHYNSGKYEVIDVIEDWNLDFSLGNAVKYIARAGKKDKTKIKEDLEKAIWYINRFINKE